MKKPILTLLLFGICLLAFSQDNEAIYPNFLGQSLDSIESNTHWVILQNCSGDLNHDGFNDLALILESKDSILEKRCTSCKYVKNKSRIIAILLHHNNIEKTIIQNNQFINRGNEGDSMMAYTEPELSIENGLLTIFYGYTRSNISYTFEYNNSDMRIISAQVVYNADGFTKDEYDFKKGEIIRTFESINEDYIEKTKINIQPKRLSEFEKMGSWEIVKDRYL